MEGIFLIAFFLFFIQSYFSLRSHNPRQLQDICRQKTRVQIWQTPIQRAFCTRILFSIQSLIPQSTCSDRDGNVERCACSNWHTQLACRAPRRLPFSAESTPSGHRTAPHRRVTVKRGKWPHRSQANAEHEFGHDSRVRAMGN